MEKSQDEKKCVCKKGIVISILAIVIIVAIALGGLFFVKLNKKQTSQTPQPAISTSQFSVPDDDSIEYDVSGKGFTGDLIIKVKLKDKNN